MHLRRSTGIGRYREAWKAFPVAEEEGLTGLTVVGTLEMLVFLLVPRYLQLRHVRSVNLQCMHRKLTGTGSWADDPFT